MPDLSPELWIFALSIAFLAGMVKGVVGFAFPMVMISGLSSLLPPDLALAALILPTLATNLWQALRTGLAAAWASAKVHWRFLAIGFFFLVFSSQLFYVLPTSLLFLIIGGPVVAFSLMQLFGWQITFAEASRRRAEMIIGAVAGFIGGLSGVWGPPTVLYLNALDTPKKEHVRVQGVVYSAAAVILMFAHMRSGVLNAETAQLSAALLVPALAGLALGFAVHDRLDQARFRRATLVVLVIAGLNLVRRGFAG